MAKPRGNFVQDVTRFGIETLLDCMQVSVKVPRDEREAGVR